MNIAVDNENKYKVNVFSFVEYVYSGVLYNRGHHDNSFCLFHQNPMSDDRQNGVSTSFRRRKSSPRLYKKSGYAHKTINYFVFRFLTKLIIY